MRELAEILALVGQPADSAAQELFHSLVALFFNRSRLDYMKKLSLKQYIGLLPRDRDKLLKIVESVKATALIPGPGIAKAGLSVKNFITVALQIPKRSAKEYVQWLLKDPSRRERTITGIFCPATHEYWKGRLRGILGDLANAEYRDEVRRKIKTVT